jgi:hypothetical protein
VNGLTITMVGDLKHGRTVHSLARYDGHRWLIILGGYVRENQSMYAVEKE